MRALIILAALLPAPALAQQDPGYDQGGLYEGVYASHRTDGDNGSVRVGDRLGGAGAGASTAAPAGAPAQPANSGVNVYKPRTLNDLALDYKAQHPAQPH
jgi:hypothetical protein